MKRRMNEALEKDPSFHGPTPLRTLRSKSLKSTLMARMFGVCTQRITAVNDTYADLEWATSKLELDNGCADLGW
jgi:hypothetical protein